MPWPTWKKWHRHGVPLYIYSSGSIAAQKLLFSHTTAGDLTPWFQGYFDTTTGPKVETESYRKISTTLEVPAEELLFLSDHPGELAAAQQAGWQVCAVQRPGTPKFPESLMVVEDFNRLPFDLFRLKVMSSMKGEPDGFLTPFVEWSNLAVQRLRDAFNPEANYSLRVLGQGETGDSTF